MARNKRYLICTKPMNALKTVLYTIVDLEEGIRGLDNLVFCFGYENKNECKARLKSLVNGDMEISHRRRIKLNIEEHQ